MSEAPVITPLNLLGEFVTEVGPKPPQDKLTTYFARLREQVSWLLGTFCIPRTWCRAVGYVVRLRWVGKQWPVYTQSRQA